jgi:hypothetical protein
MDNIMKIDMKPEMKMNWPDLAAKASVTSVCVAILGITIGSPIYLGNKIDNKIDGLRTEMHIDRENRAAESKDFHGRLCAIEERNKK